MPKKKKKMPAKMAMEKWSARGISDWFQRRAYSGARRPTHPQIKNLTNTGACTL